MTEEPKELNPAEKFITSQRRSFPSLFSSDLAVLLNLLASPRRSYDWDEDGNIICQYGQQLKESFTDEGWKYMRNAHNRDIPCSWQEPHPDSPLIHIPDNVAGHWDSAIYDLCSWVEDLDQTAMMEWIRLGVSFGKYVLEYKLRDIENYRNGFNHTAKVLKLTKQRLTDIRVMQIKKVIDGARPSIIAPGVQVYHRDYASTDRAIVKLVSLVPLPDSDPVRVAVLDRALVNGQSSVLPVSCLVPLTHPPLS